MPSRPCPASSPRASKVSTAPDSVVGNLSEGGAMLRGDAPDISRGVHIEVQIDAFSQALKSQVRMRKPGSLHVKFETPTQNAAKFLEEFHRVIQGKEIINQAAAAA